MRMLPAVILVVALAQWPVQADRNTLDKTKTQLALRLPAPPVIDGIIDIPGGESWVRAGGSIGNNNQSYWHVKFPARAYWGGEDGIQGGAIGDGSANPPADANDLRYDIWAGYDDQNLYIAVRVRDNILMSDSAEAKSVNGTTWLDDSVEIFIDGDNSNHPDRDTSGTNPAVVGSGGQFVITVNEAIRHAEAGNPGYGPNAAWYARVQRTVNNAGEENGYEAEFRISLSAIGNPKEGELIGFTVAVNDDDDGGSLERQVIWTGKPHTEASYGNLLLGLNSRAYEAPKVTRAPTIDGVVTAGEYAGAKEIKVEPYMGIYDIPSGDDTFTAADHSYSAWIVHDNDAVYVAFDVTDDVISNDNAEPGSENGNTWEDDSVEIYFDADHSHDLGRGALGFEGQYVFTANGARRHNEANNPTFGANADWFAATSKTAKGYQVEFKVKKTALSSPADGTVMGYSLDLNDDDGEGRKGQPAWAGRAHNEFTYGHLKLMGAVEPPPPVSGRQTLDKTKTQLALRLPTPPVIDGLIDIPGGESWVRAGGSIGNNNQSYWHVKFPARAYWGGEDGIQGGAIGDGSANPPADANDLRYDIWAGYDDQNLYIAVRVRDNMLMSDSAEAKSVNGTTWLDDSVEIFVDGDNSNHPDRDTSGTNPAVVGSGGQFVITVNEAIRQAEAGNPGYGPNAAWYARVQRTLNNAGEENGYEAEFRISLSAIGNPKEGDIIGFTVAVNDDDDGGSLERQVIWVGKPHTEASYGNLLLGLNSRAYDAVKVTRAPVIDGVVTAGEYAGATEIKVEPYMGIYDIPSGDDTFTAADHSYSAWIVHDNDAVYVAFDVTDDVISNDNAEPGSENGNTWEDDSVEIYFDADHSHDLGRGALGFEGQYVFTANGARRHNEANNPTFGANADWFAATSKTAKGYQVEFKVKKTALSNPADGTVMGYSLDLNDDDGEGRKGQPAWAGRAHNEFTYGHLRLLATGGAVTPAISAIAVKGNEIEFSISSSAAAAKHVLQKTSDLGSRQWSNVANVNFAPDGANRFKTLIPKPSAAAEFYRIAVVP